MAGQNHIAVAGRPAQRQAQQLPLDGSSMACTFDQPKAPSRRREQYFEMLGSRAYYKDGWMASTDVPWDPWGGRTRPTPTR